MGGPKRRKSKIGAPDSDRTMLFDIRDSPRRAKSQIKGKASGLTMPEAGKDRPSRSHERKAEGAPGSAKFGVGRMVSTQLGLRVDKRVSGLMLLVIGSKDTNPAQPSPDTGSMDSAREHDRMGINRPRRRKSDTEGIKPGLARLCIGSKLSKWRESRTEGKAPEVAMLDADEMDAKHAMLLKDKHSPAFP